MSSSNTLFPLGGPVDENDIVGREDFLKSIQARLADGQSIMLTGPRRIGKTSLALETLRRLKKEGCYVASVDFFRVSTKRELATAIIDACLENRTGIRRTMDALMGGIKTVTNATKLAMKLQGLEFSFSFPDKETSDDLLFSYALDLPQKLAVVDKKQMVVVLDEFQDAARIVGDGVFKLMRSHFQVQNKANYLFLGSKEGLMNNIFAGSDQAFYRFATILPLPPISLAAWLDYIKKKFEDRGICCNEQTIQEIIKISGGHPQDTMLVCSEIYYLLLETGERCLSLEAVQLGTQRALASLTPVFDGILDELGPAKRILIRLVQEASLYERGTHPNEIKRMIDMLINKGILEKMERGTYNFVEPLLKDYLLKVI
ncbi:ATP-binding protein [Desulfosporosinus sp. PR]|uniref:AAA family ATPase n=1 Tax=Candidatus Desulfosporosinus nitrosoreducens TaxID=3401928 RepID=UPI0027F8E1D3|nr:ATP-binding protein [Desulfosporosinus sp. PR]MDQ7095711.1 ATP-binding protein [Desulfosporosinus sp. PR]